MSNFAATASLNIRSQPKIVGGNVIGVIPPDTVVEEITDNIENGFRYVKVIMSNTLIKGFASQKYLRPTALLLNSVETLLQIPAVHYPTGDRIISRNGTGRVFPLNENGLKKIDLHDISEIIERIANIYDVINYLDVEHSLRYAPNSANTFCNIYAYDISYCLGAYLPRVWWTSDAIVKMQQGTQVPIQYDKTVSELTANRLANWFEKYGETFGWRSIFDLTIFQEEVNGGQLGILVAQRINMNNPGHIVAVVPEVMTHLAKRDSRGIVLVPLQSQAGRINRKYFANNVWWEDKSRFKKFGFWIWDKK